MKILSTNFYQSSVSNNGGRYLPVKNFDSPNDSFVKSTPSFKAGEQKVVSQGAKTLVELGTVLAAGFAAFKTLTGGDAEFKDINFDIKDFFKNLMGQQEELKDKIQKLEEENTRLKQENSELKASKENNNEPTQDFVTETIPEVSESNDEQFVKFPPKRGVLSAEQKTLKGAVIKLNISPEYNEKLTAICQDILQKGSKDAEVKAKTLALAAELEACNGDIEQLKSVVDKYDVNKENTVTAEETESPELPEEEQSSAEGDVEVFDRVSERKLIGPKTVGTIDLTQIKDPKHKRLRISQTETEAPEKSDNGKAPTEGRSPVSETAQIVPLDEAPGLYTFSFPGTLHAGTKVYLTKALNLFEKQYLSEKKIEAAEKGTKPEYIQWMFRRPVGVVSRDDVINEVEKCKTHGIRSKYNNINRATAEAVAEAINEDPRFKEMFTFHASTKFIDRLVDFNSDEPIEEQVHHAMDVLEDVLQFALKHGVTMEEHDDIFPYKDKNQKEVVDVYKGTNITIPTEYYTEEARKIFGSYPLKLGICRCGKTEHKAIICTIYPKGVY